MIIIVIITVAIVLIIISNNLCYNSPQVCLSLAVRHLQVAILVRSSREISQTVRIDCHSFIARGRISVIFEKRITPKQIAKIESPRECSLE